MAGQGYLTTHVLDTARGLPAAGLEIDLYQIDGNDRLHLGRHITNSDGRTDQPVLPVDQFAVGTYELLFKVGPYHATVAGQASEDAFLDEVPIRFRITDPNAHYHVPLLVSPFSYATYRGS